MKKPQQSLKNWTAQKWGYSSEASAKKPKSKRGRYLPESAWASLTPAEKRATNAAKNKATRKGKQFSKQPKSVAKKTRAHR